MDSVKTGREQLQKYRQNEIIEFPHSMGFNDFNVWMAVFETANEWAGWKIIALRSIQGTIEQSRQFLNEVGLNPNTIRVIATTAVTSSRPFHNLKNSPLLNGLYDEMIQKWKDVFIDVKEFSTALEYSQQRFGPK